MSQKKRSETISHSNNVTQEKLDAALIEHAAAQAVSKPSAAVSSPSSTACHLPCQLLCTLAIRLVAQ